MSLTLGDVDELSTDSDDEEYIPEGEGLSSENSEEEPEDSCAAPEDETSGAATMSRATKARRRKRSRPNGARSRKRKGKSEDEEAVAERVEEGEDEEEKRTKEKARLDQLWASFKQDAAAPLHKPADSKGKVTAPPTKRVKIQKTYDFAGEEIVVEKEVSADSKEAKQYLQSCTESAKTSEPPNSSSDSSTAVAGAQSPGGSIFQTPSIATTSLGTQSPRGSIIQTPSSVTSLSGGISSAKRGSGLGTVLKSLGKKAKMSTLEKSSMDWDQYKHKHELEEELAHSTKDGYLAKQDFLQWSDQKQFELERNERLKRFKRLH